MKHLLSASSLSVLLLASCTIQETDFQKDILNNELFFATFEQPTETGTKVYANENLLLRWHADDRVSIFNKLTYNQQYRFTGETGDNAGGFSKVDSEEFVTGNPILYVVSVSPFQESTKISEEGVLALSLAAEQQYAENSFGRGANTMVSVSADNVLQYKNVGGYLMFSLYGEGVTVSSVTLKGNSDEKISGKASVTMPLDGVPSVVMSNEATDTITLQCETPVALGASEKESTQFWFVIPPTTFPNGFTITVTDPQGKSFGKSTTKSIEIQRNTLSKMSPIEVELNPSSPSYGAQYLTFEIISGGTIEWKCSSVNYPERTIYYSLNNGAWTPITASYEDDSSILVSSGDRVRFYGNNTEYRYYSFSGTATFNVCGNIMSLISSSFENQTCLESLCTFAELFNDCSALENANHLILPATTLADRCYEGMFLGCTNLTTAPTLPATTLADGCYDSMFSGCTSLTTAPTLPATTLADGCYSYMFSDCTSLTTAPTLPATTLADGCYERMFSGCTSLTTASTLPATTLADGCYSYMFSDCTNLITAPTLPATTLARNCYRSMFSGCTNLTTASTLPATTLAEFCYDRMFYGCTNLITAPTLPATTLAEFCYLDMFSGCTNLTTAPNLPATTLADCCYRGMFSGCTNLTTPPTLPATTLAGECYGYMFYGCTNLITAPTLPATTLAGNCYSRMFYNCTNLTIAPTLPATTLADRCYEGMFLGCTSLMTAPTLPATTLTIDCYSGMFSGCTQLKTAPDLHAKVLKEGCYQGMFYGCKTLNYIKCLAENPDSPVNPLIYTSGWTYGVASQGTFIKSSTATFWTDIPENWTVISE